MYVFNPPHLLYHYGFRGLRSILLQILIIASPAGLLCRVMRALRAHFYLPLTLHTTSLEPLPLILPRRRTFNRVIRGKNLYPIYLSVNTGYQISYYYIAYTLHCVA